MRIWVIHGDNNQSYSDHANWFVGLALSIEGAVKLIEEEKNFHYYDKKDFSPIAEMPVKDKKHNIYYWDWRDEYSSKITFIIEAYELKVGS